MARIERSERKEIHNARRELAGSGYGKLGFFDRLNDEVVREKATDSLTLFASEPAATKRLFFRNILRHASPARAAQLTELGGPEQMVNRLADERNSEQVEEVMKHPEFVNGFLAATKHFASRNIGDVLGKAAAGKVGFFTKGAFGKYKERPGQVLADGLISALQEVELSGPEDHRDRDVDERRQGERRREEPEEVPEEVEPPRPAQGRGRHPEPEPAEADFFDRGGGRRRAPATEPAPAAGGRGGGRQPPAPPAAPHVPTPEERRTDDAVVEMYETALSPKPVKILEYAVRGLKHHEPSAGAFIRSDPRSARHEVLGVMESASGFISHALGNVINPRDVTKLVNHALKEEAHTGFSEATSDLVKGSARGGKPEDLYTHLARNGLFNKNGTPVDVSLGNWKTVHTKDEQHGQTRPLTAEERQGVAFHLLAQLVKHGAPDNASKHLQRFALGTEDARRDAVEAVRHLTRTPTKLSNKDLRRVLAAMVTHGSGR